VWFGAGARIGLTPTPTTGTTTTSNNPFLLLKRREDGIG
jgi:hypothetical protein